MKQRKDSLCLDISLKYVNWLNPCTVLNKHLSNGIKKFHDVVLSNDYQLNQSEKFVFNKFNKSGKGVTFDYTLMTC